MDKRDVQRLLKKQDDYVEDLTQALRNDLEALFGTVQRRVIAEVQANLEFAEGRAQASVKNRRELLRIANRIKRVAKELGAAEVVDEFVRGFDGSLVYFERSLQQISETLDVPLTPVRDAETLATLNGVKLATGQSVDKAIGVMIAEAQRSLLMSVGVIEFGDLVERLAKTFGRGLAEAETLAATALSVFLRTNADLQMQHLEESFPGLQIRYVYLGPDDKFTRPFCDELLDRTAKKAMTREEIAKLDNGQLPDVMVTCGGFNCRHSWVMDALTMASLRPVEPPAETA